MAAIIKHGYATICMARSLPTAPQGQATGRWSQAPLHCSGGRSHELALVTPEIVDCAHGLAEDLRFADQQAERGAFRAVERLVEADPQHQTLCGRNCKTERVG